jgi:hypothetical protein
MGMTLTKEQLAQRREHVEEAINSVALEGFVIEKAQLDNLERYAQGLISLEDMDAFTKANYGA